MTKAKAPQGNEKTAIYCRVSTDDKQDKGLASQLKACRVYCRNHGIETPIVYQDKISGAVITRDGLDALQQAIFMGRVKMVVVWELSRLSRSLRDGINVICGMLDKGVRLVSLKEQFDFSGSVGKLIMSVLLAVGEMERESLRERIKRGIAQSPHRAAWGGSQPKISKKEVVKRQQKGMTMTAIAADLGVSRQACYDALKR